MKITQSERIAVIETKVESIKSNTDEIKDMLQIHISHCTENYAGKWVEKVTIGSTIALVTAIIGIVIQVV